MVKADLTFINGTEHAVRAGGSRAPVTGWDSMCKKAQLSDLQHMTHWKIKGQNFQMLPVLVFTEAPMRYRANIGQNEERERFENYCQLNIYSEQKLSFQDWYTVYLFCHFVATKHNPYFPQFYQ